MQIEYIRHPDDFQINWGANQDPQEHGSIPGNMYDLNRIDVRSYHTKVYLTDFPNVPFPGSAFNMETFEMRELFGEGCREYRRRKSTPTAYTPPEMIGGDGKVIWS